MNLAQSKSYSHDTAAGSLGEIPAISPKKVSRLETAFESIGIQASSLNEKATKIENLFREFLTQQPPTDNMDNGDQSPLTSFDGRVTELHKQLSDLNHKLQCIIDRALV